MVEAVKRVVYRHQINKAVRKYAKEVLLVLMPTESEESLDQILPPRPELRPPGDRSLAMGLCVGIAVFVVAVRSVVHVWRR